LENITMNTQATVPEIKVGDWTFAGEEGRPDLDPALSYDNMEFLVSSRLGSVVLQQAALDLTKLAGAVAAAGWQWPQAVPEIKAGDWTWAAEEGDPNGEPALSYDDYEFTAGTWLTPAALRQAALDLARLANAVAAAGW
jgi:hypothetical protein